MTTFERNDDDAAALVLTTLADPRWWALHRGAWQPLGQHPDFDEAAEYADKTLPGNTWVIDAQGLIEMFENVGEQLQISCTARSAAQLRKLIKTHIEAAVSLSWAGAQPPEEMDRLMRRHTATKVDLERFIRDVTIRKV